MDSFQTPSGRQRFEIELKRSRFITTVGNADTKSGGKEFITSLRAEFPDANHHCWAMIAGRPDDMFCQDQSDDGEPKGTAGKPMLNVLRHSGMGEIVIVVTRYFGGIKLGAGGLVRAYTQSVSDALAQLKVRQTFIREEMEIELPYSLLDSLEHWLKSTNIIIGDKEFNEAIRLTLLVPSSEAGSLDEVLQELGGGAIRKTTDDS